MLDLRTEIALAAFKAILESEGVQSTDSALSDIKSDASNVADVVHIYTEAIMDKFCPRYSTTPEKPPVMPPGDFGLIRLDGS